MEVSNIERISLRQALKDELRAFFDKLRRVISFFLDIP